MQTVKSRPEADTAFAKEPDRLFLLPAFSRLSHQAQESVSERVLKPLPRRILNGQSQECTHSFLGRLPVGHLVIFVIP